MKIGKPIKKSIELSGYYYVNDSGKLVCLLEGKTAEVIGVMQTDSGYIHFLHRIINKEK